MSRKQNIVNGTLFGNGKFSETLSVNLQSSYKNLIFVPYRLPFSSHTCEEALRVERHDKFLCIYNLSMKGKSALFIM